MLDYNICFDQSSEHFYIASKSKIYKIHIKSGNIQEYPLPYEKRIISWGILRRDILYLEMSPKTILFLDMAEDMKCIFKKKIAGYLRKIVAFEEDDFFVVSADHEKKDQVFFQKISRNLPPQKTLEKYI